MLRIVRGFVDNTGVLITGLRKEGKDRGKEQSALLMDGFKYSQGSAKEKNEQRLA
jgi:hypothetical protein